MKILHTPVRIYATGGVESYVLNLSRSLADLGHGVSVICSDSARDMCPDRRVSVKALMSAAKIANTDITPGLPMALLREDFDLVHTHLPTPWSADWSAIACAAKGRPLILTYHNDIVGEGYAGHVAGLYNATALKLLLRRANRILVARPRHISPRLRPYMDKVEFVPVGVDAEAFRHRKSEAEGDIFFLSVLDEFHRYKGLDVLLEALQIVKAEIPEVMLVVGGGGVLLDHYRHQAKALGLEENVRFEGRIPKERLLDIYNGCKLFVLPSLCAEQEGFGIVPLEAMACSVPVVVTDIVGVAEDVERCGAGMVVRPGGRQALAKAIISILGDEKNAAKMGLAGRRLVEKKYSWKRVALQVEGIYREVI
jgi:glycosyltransferase involved in cell wall biosynthesis